MQIKSKLVPQKAATAAFLSDSVTLDNGLVYVSGQVPSSVDKIGTLPIEVLTREVLENLKSVLERSNSSLQHVVKINIFLTDMSLFARVNKVYCEYFGEIKPARSCVAVKQLPLGTPVEIEAVATEIPIKAKL